MWKSTPEEFDEEDNQMHPHSLPYLKFLSTTLKDTDKTLALADSEIFWQDVSKNFSNSIGQKYSAAWCIDSARRLGRLYLATLKSLLRLEDYLVIPNTPSREDCESSDATRCLEPHEYMQLFHNVFEGNSNVLDIVGARTSDISTNDPVSFQDMVIRQPRYSTLHPEMDWGVMTSLAQLAQENLVNLNDIACAQSSLSASSYAAFAFLNAKDNNTKADMIHSTTQASLERKKSKYV